MTLNERAWITIAVLLAVWLICVMILTLGWLLTWGIWAPILVCASLMTISFMLLLNDDDDGETLVEQKKRSWK